MGAVCCNQQGQDFEEISEFGRAGAGKGGRGQTPSPGGDAIMMVVVVGISQWKKQEQQMKMVRFDPFFHPWSDAEEGGGGLLSAILTFAPKCSFCKDEHVGSRWKSSTSSVCGKSKAGESGKWRTVSLGERSGARREQVWRLPRPESTCPRRTWWQHWMIWVADLMGSGIRNTTVQKSA